MRWLAVVVWTVVQWVPVYGQTLVSATSALGADGRVQYLVKIQMPGVRPAQAVVAGAPYSADEVVDETGPDGVVVRMEELGRRHFRDSQGRVRVDYVPCPGSGLPAMPRLTEISDAVGGFDYIIDAPNRVVHRVRRLKPGEAAAVGRRVMTAPPMASASGGAAPVTANREEVQVEQEPVVAVRPGAELAPAAEALPAREWEGLRAEVKRMTTVLANYDPNAAVRTTWSEVWDSPELGVRLLTKVVDAENRQRTTALKNIRRGEPAGELFSVPAGYELRDEPGAFVIEWTLR